MRTLAQDIASATRLYDAAREPWPVDQLTRTVFVRSMTAFLEPSEAALLRTACAEPRGQTDRPSSEDGRVVYRLISALDVGEAAAALERPPTASQGHLDAMSLRVGYPSRSCICSA